MTDSVCCRKCGTSILSLENQKSQLEHERGIKITKKDLLTFIAELVKGDKNCTKKRDFKDPTEDIVFDCVLRFLKDPKNLDVIITDTLKHQEHRTSDDGLKSIDTKIQHMTKQVEDWTRSYVSATSEMLKANIEKQIMDYEIILKDLSVQKAELELERGKQATKEDMTAFVTELIKGDPNDKAFRKQLIDILVSKVFIYNDKIAVFFKFSDGSEIVTIDYNEDFMNKVAEFIKEYERKNPQAVSSNLFLGGGE